MATQINLAMTPAQYSTARAALLSNSQVTEHVEVDANSGSFSTAQISMTYEYANGNLALSIVAKYGIAKFASTGTIASRLKDLLAQVA